MSTARFSLRSPWRDLLLGSLLGACVPARSGPPPAPAPVATSEVQALTAGAPWTVVVFFSAHCPCQQAHDERLRDLAATYAPRGVRFVLVDAEADASVARDQQAARDRAYPFAIYTNPTGALADALGASYATYTVVLDDRQRPRYRGGLDSDKVHLTPDAHFYVRDALDALLAGRDPPVTEGKTLGCALRRR